MRELSIFVDESGSQHGHSKYCLVTLLLHDQSKSINKNIEKYEECLRRASLPNIAFHASPLMNGHDEYETLSMASRKQLLGAFEAFARGLPYSYKTFSYKRSEVEPTWRFITRFKRDLVEFLTNNIEFFQEFDRVKIYYDNGQQMVTQALHGAIDFMLSKEAVLYRMVSARKYRLFQVVDYICALELTDLKFRDKCLTATDAKIFGQNYQYFKRNHLKKARRKSF